MNTRWIDGRERYSSIRLWRWSRYDTTVWRGCLASFKTGCALLNVGGDTFFGIFTLE